MKWKSFSKEGQNDYVIGEFYRVWKWEFFLDISHNVIE